MSLRGEVSWAPTSVALDSTYGLRVLQPPSVGQTQYC